MKNEYECTSCDWEGNEPINMGAGRCCPECGNSPLNENDLSKSELEEQKHDTKKPCNKKLNKQ